MVWMLASMMLNICNLRSDHIGDQRNGAQPLLENDNESLLFLTSANRNLMQSE